MAEAQAVPGRKPVALIVLGMAGSGKTSFVQRLVSNLHSERRPPYVVNLDPAALTVPFPVNVDIRDTVKYKDVMKKYSLGPNGAITTSLNLFATKFDQVLQLLEGSVRTEEFVVFDTPGQIEVFTWSASGTIISESLASSLPTVLIYVMDVVRSSNPVTFMSNMLYSCSILYKYRLPFVIVMNKIDVVSHEFAISWMRDFERFNEALDDEASTSFAASFCRSLNLYLEEFYQNISCVGVSAVTGAGFSDFMQSLKTAEEEYYKVYDPALKQKISKRQQAEVEGNLERFRIDRDADKKQTTEEDEEMQEYERFQEEFVKKHVSKS